MFTLPVRNNHIALLKLVLEKRGKVLLAL